MHIFEKSNDDFEDIILSDHEEYYKQIIIYKHIQRKLQISFLNNFEGHENLYFCRMFKR